MAMPSNEFLALLNDFIGAADESLNISQFVSENSLGPKRYSMTELEALTGIQRARIYKVLDTEAIPPLQSTPGNNRRYATIEHILAIQKHFGTSPQCGDGERAVTIAFSTPKGGSYKTSSCYGSMGYFSERGYRVLLVDLDPQGTLSMLMDKAPDVDIQIDDTICNFLLDVEGFEVEKIREFAVKKTRLPNVDIIPACMSLQVAEMLLTSDIVAARMQGDKEAVASVFYRLNDILEELKDDYDIIIIDGTPSFGLLATNIVFACDCLIVPVPTAINDFAATKKFMELLQEYITSYLNLIDHELPLPEIRFLATRFNNDESESLSSSKWLKKIRDTFGGYSLNAVSQKHDSAVSNSMDVHRSVYEINPHDLELGSKAFRKAKSNYDEIFGEILQELILPHWPSKLAR